MQLTRHVCLAFGAILVAGSPAVTAQEMSTQILLPDPVLSTTGLGPWGYGKALLADPLPSADPRPDYQSLFLGTLADPKLTSTIWRIDPNPNATPPFSEFTVTPLDARFRFVKEIAYNKVDKMLYAAGDANVQNTKPKSTSQAWLVRQSSYAQSGAANVWNNSEPPFVLAAGAESRAQGIAIDPAGAVYVSGRARDAKGYSHTIIRRKAPGGSWEKVYDKLNTSYTIVETKICYFPGSATAPEAVPAAYVMVGNENNKWTILRSTTGNSGTWTPVDTTWSANASAGAKDIVYDKASGKLFVAGYLGTFGSGANGWVVRVSETGGQTWSELLKVACTSYSYADGITTDGLGNVWVSGNVGVPQSDGSSAPQIHLVRCTTSANASGWQSSFLSGVPLPFDETNCYNSFGPAITADTSGAVFSGSAIYNWTDSSDSPAKTYAGWSIGLLRLTPATP